MRYIIFADYKKTDDKFLEGPAELYEIMYDGIVGSPRGFDKSEARIIGRVLSKLEKIGTTTEREKRKTFALKDEDHVVELEDTEFKLAIEALEAIRWTALFSRKAADMFDWLDATPKERPAAKLVQYAPQLVQESPQEG